VACSASRGRTRGELVRPRVRSTFFGLDPGWAGLGRVFSEAIWSGWVEFFLEVFDSGPCITPGAPRGCHRSAGSAAPAGAVIFFWAPFRFFIYGLQLCTSLPCRYLCLLFGYSTCFPSVLLCNAGAVHSRVLYTLQQFLHINIVAPQGPGQSDQAERPPYDT
jgi:hypothetical protein